MTNDDKRVDMSNELTLRDIAGFCPEEAIWKMLADVSDFLLKEDCGYQISTDTIAVTGNQFMVTGEKNQASREEMVWTLGATAFYAATGHPVFGGHGYSYQQEHPHVALPVLQKSFQALTPVIHQCLCIDAADRISMEQLRRFAEKGLTACSQRQRVKSDPVKELIKENSHHGEKWPEEMKAG